MVVEMECISLVRRYIPPNIGFCHNVIVCYSSTEDIYQYEEPENQFGQQNIESFILVKQVINLSSILSARR